ncbi:MAG: thiamine phosphate synthase [Mariprofundaceae bacterium]
MKRVEGIYGILPADLPLNELLEKAEAAMEGGVRTLQLRDKKQQDDQLLERAFSLRKLTLAHEALLIINDSLRIALEVKADGVHFGPADCPNITQLKSETDPDIMVGISCKADASFARHVLNDGADYLSFGAIFPTKSKANVPAIGLPRLEKARHFFPEANIVAIGGINAQNLKDARQAGADAAAVISGLFGADNIEEMARKLVQIWETG